MDENHQDTANNHLATTQDVEWVVSKKSKLLIPQRKNQIKVNRGWTGFSGRTLWDWIQFFAVLAIPIIVAAGTLYFTQQITLQQAQLSNTANEKQHQTDIQIAQDQQQVTTLKTYIDDIRDLLLNKDLRKSKPGDEVRVVARTETLETLTQLDSKRKKVLLSFIYEAGLIDANHDIISLANADLFGVDLAGINLSGADLSNVDLRNAYLAVTDLHNANLQNASLSYAILNDSFLNGANLDGADLSSTDLSNIQMSHASLQNTQMFFAILQNAILIGSRFNDARLNNADLSNADLNNSDLKDTDLTYANFIETTLNGADLTSADLTHAKITQKQLAQAQSLHNATMPDGSIHP